MEHVRLGSDAGRLVQHADEVLDGLLGALGGHALAVLLQVVGRLLVVLIEDARRNLQAGVPGEQRLLLLGPLVLRRIPGRAQLAAERLGEFLEFDLDRLGDQLLSLGVDLLLDRLGLGL